MHDKTFHERPYEIRAKHTDHDSYFATPLDANCDLTAAQYLARCEEIKQDDHTLYIAYYDVLDRIIRCTLRIMTF